jgi:hypothetical protein
VVDITKDFYLTSPVNFDQPLVVYGDVDVTEPVDGYTVESIMSEALTMEDNQTITGEWDFTSVAIFKEDVSGEGDFEDFDIQALIDSKNAEIKETELRITREKEKYKELCHSIVNMTEDYVSNPVKLDSFDSHQSIALRYQVLKKQCFHQSLTQQYCMCHLHSVTFRRTRLLQSLQAISFTYSH